ncbi:hypothetical protein MAR_019816 [Mya arenaria]|uniref:Uncharacterized protein n=1 Tax=Mya arenaria TaxID=6604 RepID=A0ABY7E358_MYAAR|nr:hypothetical protein MAR_019816 [Mya arenaria]
MDTILATCHKYIRESSCICFYIRFVPRFAAAICRYLTHIAMRGLLLKLPVFDQDQLGEVDDLYEDAVLWNLPEEEEHEHAKKYIEDKNGSQMSEMPRVTEEKGSCKEVGKGDTLQYTKVNVAT